MRLNFRLCIVIGILSQQTLNASFEDELSTQKHQFLRERSELMRQNSMYKAELMTSRLYYPQDMCFYTEEICLTEGVNQLATFVIYHVFNNQNTFYLFETYKDIYFQLYNIYQSYELWRTDHGHENPGCAFAKMYYDNRQLHYLCSHLNPKDRKEFLEEVDCSQILKSEEEAIRKYFRS